MIEFAMKHFALSRQGAKDFYKATFAMVLMNFVLIFPVWLLYFLVEDTLNGGIPTEHYYLYGFGVAGILIAMFFVYWLTYDLCFLNTYKESATLRINTAERLRKLPLSFFAKKDLSDLTNLILDDSRAIEQGFSHYMPNFFGSLIFTLLMGIGIFIYDWRLGLAALWVYPIAMALVFGSYKIQTHFNKAKSDASIRLNDSIQETLEGFKDIAQNGRKKEAIEKIDNDIDALEKRSILGEFGLAAFVLSASCIIKLGIPTVCIVGSILLGTGELSLIGFFMYILLVSRLYDPMLGAMQNLAAVISLFVPAQRMRDINAIPPQEGTTSFFPKNHDIVFKDVSFCYEDEEEVINGVSFTAKQGEVTALSGPSGCGKSTISRLASRFWDVDEGSITLGGVDISTVDPETLLEHYSIVFQDVVLFDETILENIRIGKKDATDEEVYQAARLAHCDEFVSKLKDGYDTMIGENGAKLSGGERQRISIARALLKDAPVILLDEATASLDVENETEIQSAIGRLIKDKTVLLIAHRMRTIEDADKAIVLKKGKIIEEGKPSELIAKGGYFADALSMQKKAENWKI